MILRVAEFRGAPNIEQKFYTAPNLTRTLADLTIEGMEYVIAVGSRLKRRSLIGAQDKRQKSGSTPPKARKRRV